MFVAEHLEKFQEFSEQNDLEWLGTEPASWYSYLVSNACFRPSNTLSQKKLSRNDLFALTKSSTVSPFDCVVSILAWGGMNRKHGTKVLSTFNKWSDVVDEMRSGRICRYDAFDRFQKLRKKGCLQGMGIAYFTKLIYFLSAEPRGYILDQWTARSTNLLCGKEKINLTWGKFQNKRFAVVNDSNTVTNYSSFCDVVVELTSLCNHLSDPGETEAALFSEGRGKGRWRSYVIENDFI